MHVMQVSGVLLCSHRDVLGGLRVAFSTDFKRENFSQMGILQGK